MTEEEIETEHSRIPKPPPEGQILKRDKHLHDQEESETARNTRLNASLYHTSDESIQQYKQLNDSTDLLGRLYYDDYDSNSNILSPELLSPASSVPHTPLISPMITVTGGGGGEGGDDDEFNFGTSPTPKSAILNSHLSSSSTSLSSLPKSAMSKTSRPNLSRGVSFDTGEEGPKKSFTLKIKHPEYKFRRNNKTWLVGFNNDAESTKAIEWLFDEMVIHGDTIVILQVLDEKKYASIDKLKANVNLSTFANLNVHFKKVSMLFEVVIGKPEKSLKMAIAEYAPSMMVIGTHHYTERDKHSHHHRGFLSKSSLSKHFLECALVPVIIVKPTYNYIENLSNPIDSESYFVNWIKRVPTGPESNEDQMRQNQQQGGSLLLHRKVNSFLSPTSSRNSSYTNLVAEERGRSSNQLNPVLRLTNESRSRSTSRTRSAFSKFFRKHDD